MTTIKIPPPRKLTEIEDMDSFDDWWFQAICYYGRDENFKEFFDTPNFTWQGKSVPNRGLTSALKAANLTCLLRALATHAIALWATMCGYHKKNFLSRIWVILYSFLPRNAA